MRKLSRFIMPIVFPLYLGVQTLPSIMYMDARRLPIKYYIDVERDGFVDMYCERERSNAKLQCRYLLDKANSTEKEKKE